MSIFSKIHNSRSTAQAPPHARRAHNCTNKFVPRLRLGAAPPARMLRIHASNQSQDSKIRGYRSYSSGCKFRIAMWAAANWTNEVRSASSWSGIAKVAESVSLCKLPNMLIYSLHKKDRPASNRSACYINDHRGEHVSPLWFSDHHFFDR